jgi:hypothetical protein
MFAKVFHQIFDSSIRQRPDTRFTFIDMLILADRHGIVDMTHEAIAARTNRPLRVIKETILELEGPDPRSRTPDFNGARIKRLDDHRDWGWFIINYEKFRLIASEEQRREKTKERVRKYRARKAVTQRNADVTHGDACNAMQRQMYSTEEANASSVVTTQLSWSVTTGWNGLTKELETEFSAAYPACNIKRQFLCMEQWLKANSQKAHKSNWRRFAINWLKRAQDRGGDLGSSGSRNLAPQSKSRDVTKHE